MSNCGGCASARDRCGNGLEKIYPTTAVRYGRMNHIGEFTHSPDLAFSCGGKVVIATDRGIEVGQQVSLTCHGCDKSVDREQMRAYAKASGGDALRLNNGRIVREATESDLAEMRHIESQIFDKIQTCRRLAVELNLDMKIVDAEHVFGGERIIFYFMSESRVDFRELVRQLAREFQTRIEMRQVGARDEARLLADYETCGRECCCKNFLKTLKPVGMQMAKLQKATLDPSKVSGRCGRLKCCLRYEHDSYAELNKKLPRVGKRVRTATDEGKVIDRQVLTQLLKLRKDDGTIVTVCNEDVVERDLPEPPPMEEGAAPTRENGRDSGRRGSRGDQRPQPGARNNRGEGGQRRDRDRGRGQPLREIAPGDTSQRPSRPDEGESTEDTPPPDWPELVDETTGAVEADTAEQEIDDTGLAGPSQSADANTGTSAENDASEQPGQEGSTAQGSTPAGQDPPRRRGRNRRRRRRPGRGGQGHTGSPGNPSS